MQGLFIPNFDFIPPPSVLIVIRYDYYEMARARFWHTYSDLFDAYGSFENDIFEPYYTRNHWGSTKDLLKNAVLVHTPVSSGQLNRSIQEFVHLKWGPIESLTWEIGRYDEDQDVTIFDSVEDQKPRYRYVCIICCSQLGYTPLNYAFPVEMGSGAHKAPTRRLREWVTVNWPRTVITEEGEVRISDRQDAFRLQRVIAKRGTPDHAMFWKGFLLAGGAGDIYSALTSNTSIPPEYWDIYKEEYNLVPISLLKDF